MLKTNDEALGFAIKFYSEIKVIGPYWEGQTLIFNGGRNEGHQCHRVTGSVLFTDFDLYIVDMLHSQTLEPNPWPS